MLMFKYDDNCGHCSDFIPESDLDQIVEYMKQLTPNITPEGPCHGVDINHTEAYDWFVVNILNRLRKYTGRPDLNLIFGMYADLGQSFRIHTDFKTIPENEHNPNGKQFASFLIPISVDHNKERCSVNSTMVFEMEPLPEDQPAKEQPWHYRIKHINPPRVRKQYGTLDYRHYELVDEIYWKTGDLIWWNSLYPHCGVDNAAIGIKDKQMLVIHTYV